MQRRLALVEAVTNSTRSRGLHLLSLVLPNKGVFQFVTLVHRESIGDGRVWYLAVRGWTACGNGKERRAGAVAGIGRAYGSKSGIVADCSGLPAKEHLGPICNPYW